MVDGTRLMPQRASSGPSDVLFELPLELTQGRESVAVKFTALPGKSVPGVTQIRVLKSETAN